MYISLSIHSSYFYNFTHPVFLSPLHNISNILQYDLVRESHENDFKEEIAKKEKTLHETKSTAETISKKHSDQLEHMAARVSDSDKAKEKEKARDDEAEQAVSVLKKSLEMAKAGEAAAKVALGGFEDRVKELEGQVDLLKADV